MTKYINYYNIPVVSLYFNDLKTPECLLFDKKENAILSNYNIVDWILCVNIALPKHTNIIEKYNENYSDAHVITIRHVFVEKCNFFSM